MTWNPAAKISVVQSVALRTVALLSICVAVDGTLLAQEGKSSDRTLQLTLMDAIQLTLREQPQVEIAMTEVTEQEGVLQEASGAFDWMPQLLQQTSIVRRKQEVFSDGYSNQSTYVYGVQVERPTRTGITGGVRANVTQNVSDNEGQQTVSVLQLVGIIPLMQGFGVGIADAEERAARVDLRAARYAYRQSLAEIILQTATAYWNLRGARQALEIRQQAESLAEDNIDKIKLLVRMGVMTEQQQVQGQADYQSKQAARIAAEEMVFEAERQLALALGLPREQLSSSILLSDPFPDPAGNQVRYQETTVSNHLMQAFENRGDYLASRLGEQAQRILLRLAENGMLPQFDLELAMGYSGVVDGDTFSDNFNAFAPNTMGGLNIQGQATLAWPPQNNLARGRVLQSQSQLRRSILNTEELSRQIETEIRVAIHQLEWVSRQWEMQTQAAASYEQSVELERRLLSLGQSTLIDVIAYQDAFIQEQLALVQNAANYAIGLARLRFASGTLLPPETDLLVLRRENLYTTPELPGIDQGRSGVTP